ncbi:MAG: 50S ribosomal protein L23 [Fimbriimonadales bacterium]
MRDPHEIVLRPRITERSTHLSYGDENAAKQRMLNEARAESKRTGKRVQPHDVSDKDLVRKYTFEVATDSNKLEIKAAIEAIYNAGRKKEDAISVTNVRTMKILGKKRRRARTAGYEPDRKKAVVTLGAGQILEDYGV